MTDKKRKEAREEIMHNLLKNAGERPRKAERVGLDDMSALNTIIRVQSGQRDTAISRKELIETARAVACERNMEIEVPDRRKR